MIKRILLAGLAVFVAWTILDILIHAVLLGSTYAANPQLWRPHDEMKFGLLHLVVFISAIAFAGIYGQFVGGKNLPTAIKFGLWFGLATGVGMGYGTYAVLPIPHYQAVVWFFGHLVEGAVGGLIVGWILKE